MQMPPAIRIDNSAICTQFTDFISDTFVHWVASGVLAVWGEVRVVSPPHLVLPIMVEPSKPCLCHDERFLNLWIKDLPFKLDHLSICLSMFCLGISRPPLMTKVGISMFVSIRRQKHTLDLNGKTFSSYSLINQAVSLGYICLARVKICSLSLGFLKRTK